MRNKIFKKLTTNNQVLQVFYQIEIGGFFEFFDVYTVAQNEICGQSDGTKVFPVDFTWDIHGYDEKMCPGNIWPGLL